MLAIGHKKPSPRLLGPLQEAPLPRSSRLGRPVPPSALRISSSITRLKPQREAPGSPRAWNQHWQKCLLRSVRSPTCVAMKFRTTSCHSVKDPRTLQALLIRRALFLLGKVTKYDNLPTNFSERCKMYLQLEKQLTLKPFRHWWREPIQTEPLD